LLRHKHSPELNELTWLLDSCVSDVR